MFADFETTFLLEKKKPSIFSLKQPIIYIFRSPTIVQFGRSIKKNNTIIQLGEEAAAFNNIKLHQLGMHVGRVVDSHMATKLAANKLCGLVAVHSHKHAARYDLVDVVADTKNPQCPQILASMQRSVAVLGTNRE